MVRALVCLGLFIAATNALFANPKRDAREAVSPVDQRQARNYATQLAELTQFIVEQYVRDLSREEVAEAALHGLYEAAGVPVPGDLHAETRRAASASEYEMRKLFARVRLSVGNPPALEGAGAIYVSLQSLTKRLDPYSGVRRGPEARIDPLDARRGFGLELVDTSGAGPLVIRSVIPGSPAQKAGLRPGDEITTINDTMANTGMATPLALTRLETVHVVARRPGMAYPIKAALKAEVLSSETILGVIRKPDNAWEFMLDREHSIAQIRVAALDPGIVEEMSRALQELREAHVRGLILDLRWCPGGYLDPSRDMADLFLGKYNVANMMQPTPAAFLTSYVPLLEMPPRNATVHSRNDQLDRRPPHSFGEFTNFPMVVLVNGATTGGAELVAAVLQDNKRARIAGQRTRGKASVQRKWSLGGEVNGLTLTVPIPDMELKLTNGILERPSGKNMHRFPHSKPGDDWGVRPDAKLEFWVSAAVSQRLHDWWQLQNLRPGTDNTALPLDDPAADPQRQAALQVLLDVLK